MSTYELLREGEWTEDGRLLQEGAVTWRDDVLPVVDPDGGGIVGQVTNIRREGRSILGDVSIEMPEGKRPTADVHRMDLVDRQDHRLEFSAAELYGVNISGVDSYPWKEK